ncbi:hypothetical protein CAEBREN_05607 [Caenorhabditis brenneri]|uniref:Uncharacterized protein n=1 Tax=Caenorhabditis brenneri TaxID=135651 RepID=G0PCA4_CAEBE|nr:hypothetical protein CAEBREN_05607 [Caenorhabditis brenneri]
MNDAPRSFSDDSFSSDDSHSSSEPMPNSPPIFIRRPIHVPIAAAPPIPLAPNSSPYPRDADRIQFQMATPVIVTPVDARSTRDLVRANRIRRVRRHQEPRYVLNSIRRRLSLRTPGETQNEIEMNTPRTLPRSKRIDKTSTAIELESVDAFQTVLTEMFKTLQINTKSPVKAIPSASVNCAKIREFNRLEAVDIANLALTSDSEEYILKAITLLEWNMSQLDSETAMIDLLLNDFEEERKKNLRRWTQLEQIISLMNNED